MDAQEKKTLNQAILALSAIVLVSLLISLFFSRIEHKTVLTLAYTALCIVCSALGLFACKGFKQRWARLTVAIAIVSIPSALFFVIIVDPIIVYPSFITTPGVLVLGDLLVQRFRGHGIF